MQRGKKQTTSKSPSDSKKVSTLVVALLQWFSENARDLPWRRTDDPYGIWVSEIMLQQTQVKTVIPYWERWMHELPTVSALAAAPSDRIHKLWEGLGYYTRVRNMQKAAVQIVEKHGGKFPGTFDEVLALPGIGCYTAGAICSIAFNQAAPILDGNVIRVLTRLFSITENPREKEVNARLWTLAKEFVATAKRSHSEVPHACSHLNQSLMELGALICTPRQPKCLLCPVRNGCRAHKENRAEQLPNLGERTVATERRFVAFVVRDENRFLVRQRPAGIVNAHLWEFPNIEIALDAKNLSTTEGFELEKNPKPICRIRHSITRYRILLEAFSATTNRKVPGCWYNFEELEKLAFTSAHKKILKTLAADRS